jgi:hypothetical protein
MDDGSGPYGDIWSDTPTAELMRQRPLGVTILAILQILGTLITVGVIVALPLLSEGKTIKLLGESVFYMIIIYAIIMIPISLFLAYGLLHGKEWARVYTRFFQIFNIISALLSFNIFGIIIPIYIFFYLNKFHVVQFFDKKSPLSSRSFPLFIAAFISLLILSGYLSVYTNPVVQWDIQEQKAVSSQESFLVGTWHNTNGDITLQFNSNHSCEAIKDGVTYEGTWEINKYFYYIDLNWVTSFQLVHPNRADYYYTIDQAYFIGSTLSLYSMFESPPYYICYKE